MSVARSLDLESLLSLVREHKPYCRWSSTGKGRLGFGEFRDTADSENQSLKLDALGLFDFKLGERGEQVKSLWQLGRELGIEGCSRNGHVPPEKQKKDAAGEERQKATRALISRLEGEKWKKESADILWKYFSGERKIPFPSREVGLKFLHDDLHAAVQAWKGRAGELQREIIMPLRGCGGELVQMLKIAVDGEGRRVKSQDAARGKKLKFSADADRAVMFGPEGAHEAIVCEGIEDALSIRWGIEGAENIRFFVVCGRNFGRVKGLVEDGGHESRIVVLDNDEKDESLLGSLALGERFLRYRPKQRKHDANRALLDGSLPGLRTWFEELECLDWKNVSELADAGDSEEEKSAAEDSYEFHRIAYPDTDSGAAKFLAKKFGRKIRVTEDGNWWVWTGKVWSTLHAGGQLRQWIAALAPVYRRQAKKLGEESEPGKDMLAFAKSLGSNARQQSVLACLQGEKSIRAKVDDFDAEPGILNVQNGILDLETGELLEHAPERLCSRIAAVPWDNSASAPTFGRFLSEICLDDHDLIGYKLRQLGYLASGYTHEKAFFFHLGEEGNNGKSVEAALIRWLLGGYARTVATELFMEQRFSSEQMYEFANLPGVRLIIASETDENKIWSEAVIKKMTGDTDELTARHIRGRPFTFQPRFKPMVHGNNKPKTKTGDPAFWFRMHLVPYDLVLPAEQRDPHLLEKLMGEGSGILKIIYAGFREWRRGGLVPPEKVQQARSEYRSEIFSDVTQFIEAHCDKGSEFEEKSSALYEAYENHCRAKHRTPKSLTGFGRELSRQGFDVKKNVIKYRIGLKLRESVQIDDDHEFH